MEWRDHRAPCLYAAQSAALARSNFVPARTRGRLSISPRLERASSLPLPVMDASSHRVESRSQGAESGSQRVEWLVSTLLGLARGEVELSIDSDEYAMAAQELEKLNVALNDSDDDSLMSLLIDLNMPAAVEAAIEHVAAHHDECDDADSSLAYECAQMVMAIVRRRKDAGTMLRSIPTLFSVVLDVQMMPDVRQTAADVLVALTSETDRTDGKSISCLKLWNKFNNLVTCERYLVGACSFALQEAMLWLMCSWPQCDAIVKVSRAFHARLAACKAVMLAPGMCAREEGNLPLGLLQGDQTPLPTRLPPLLAIHSRRHSRASTRLCRFVVVKRN